MYFAILNARQRVLVCVREWAGARVRSTICINKCDLCISALTVKKIAKTCPEPHFRVSPQKAIKTNVKSVMFVLFSFFFFSVPLSWFVAYFPAKNNYYLFEMFMDVLPVIVNDAHRKMPRNHFISFPECAVLNATKQKCAYFVSRGYNPSRDNAMDARECVGYFFLSCLRSVKCVAFDLDLLFAQ